MECNIDMAQVSKAYLPFKYMCIKNIVWKVCVQSNNNPSGFFIPSLMPFMYVYPSSTGLHKSPVSSFQCSGYSPSVGAAQVWALGRPFNTYCLLFLITAPERH